jgi:hypothetical protein
MTEPDVTEVTGRVLFKKFIFVRNFRAEIAIKIEGSNRIC